MTESRGVAILTEDLMFDSRLRSALRDSGHTVTTIRGDQVPAAGVIFVDLNREPDRRLAAIEIIHREQPAAQIVGFCHHGEKELRKTAMARGASQVVTNDSVPAVALRLLGSGEE